MTNPRRFHIVCVEGQRYDVVDNEIEIIASFWDRETAEQVANLLEKSLTFDQMKAFAESFTSPRVKS